MLCIVHIGQFPLSKEAVRGGIEASVFGLSKVQSTKYEVHVFDVPRIGGDDCVENVEGVVVHRFSNSGGRQLSARRRVPLMLKKIIALHPDVCHIHGTSLFAWQMYLALKKEGMNVVVTVHGLVLVEKRNALKKKFSAKKLFQYWYQGDVEKRFLSQLPMAIVDTEYVKDKVNQYPIRRKPEMFVVPQGIDEAFFSINCSDSSRMVLSVGAIGERKGHLITLKAFEQAIEKGLKARLVVAGTMADEQYLGKLQEAIAQSKYRSQISLLTDLADQDLKQLYEKAHLFVLHSEEESQGIVFAEAMATGLPVVSTNVGGIPCVIEVGKNGLLSDYGDVETFADNIYRLMDDAEMWHTMSAVSKQVSQQYHWMAIGERITQIYLL